MFGFVPNYCIFVETIKLLTMTWNELKETPKEIMEEASQEYGSD